MDAERYQENITIPQNIMVRGSDAILEGTVVLNNNSYFDMYAHYARVSDSVMVSKVGNSHSYYKVVIQDAKGTLGSLTGCTNLRSNTTGGTLFAQIELQKVAHVGVKEETAVGIGHIHIRIKDMYLAADNAIGIYGVGAASDIVGTVDHILMSGSLSNTKGIVFNSTSGSLNITSNKIAATIAYNVTSGNVKISCPDITGTTSGNVGVVLTTGNLSDSLNLDSSTTPASSKAVKTVNDKLSTTQTELQEAIDNINPATTTSRGIGRIATLADMKPGAGVTNAPAFLDVKGGVITPTPTANAVVQAGPDGKMAAGWLNPDENKANKSLDNVTNNAIGLYLYVRDEKPNGTQGGAATAGAWQTRDLQTVVHNIGATLAGNKITLSPGRYYVRANAPAYATGYTRLAIYDVTEAAYKMFGPFSRYNLGSSHCFDIGVEGEITFSVQHTIELRMWAQIANANGLGYIDSNTSGVAEIFSEVRIWKM